MIFLKIGENNEILMIHNRPFDPNPKNGLGKSEEELLQEGILVESLPEPEEIEGKIPILKFNGTELYYEYIDIPLTPEEEFQQRIELIQQVLDDILLGGIQ